MAQQGTHFSAVVVSFYTGPALNRCLEALFKDPLCRQIIVVDNGNPPDVLNGLKLLANAQTHMSVLTGHGNIGFGQGCNLGAGQAREAMLVFINPDCVIDEGALAAFARAKAMESGALLGGALRNEDGSEQRGCRRGELTLRSAIVSFAGLGKPGPEAGIWRDFNRTHETPPTQLAEMPVVSGALMAIVKATFDAIGGFDRAFFLHVEDVDLCRRVRGAGHKVLHVPDATALHIGATSEVSSWVIERAKIASFTHYFWKHARGLWGRIGVVLIIPLLTAAIVARWTFRRR